MPNKKILAVILLTSILAIGFFLRIYNINGAPPGIYPDEAVNGIDALTANDSGEYKWFYPANQGREALFINLQAMCLKFFGVSVLSLKIAAITIGTLTILGTFLLAKELFSVRIGLISSFLVATSFWAINFSRIGFRANMLPFILVFSFYFFFKGLRTQKLSAFAIAGFIFGLGMHTYIAFRIAPAILIFVLIALILSKENFLKKFWKHLLFFVIFAAIAAAPMFYTLYIAHPEYSESRSSSISIFSPEVNQGNLIGTFLKSFGLSLTKYSFWGDQNWRHNYPPYPILDPAIGLVFLFGLFYSLKKFLQTAYLRLLKKERIADFPIFAFLIAWFFLMLAPEFLTAEGNPHALRAIGTLPVVFILTALSFNHILNKARAKSFVLRKITFSLIISILLLSGLFNAIKYHYFWANKIETARSFEKVLMEISSYIKTLPASQKKYVVTGSMQRIPILLFNWKDPNIFYVYPSQIEQISPDNNDYLIIMTEYNEKIISTLRQRFLDLDLIEIQDTPGISYYILKNNK